MLQSFTKILPKFLRPETNAAKDKSDKYCRILLLDDTEVRFNVKPNHKGQSVLTKVYKHLNLVENEYFGLRLIDNLNQTQWLDPSRGLGSQFKGPPPYTFYFGVKYYAADPCKLKEEITRYQFFLQVKKDILQGRLPITFETAAKCFGYAVQSELGDFDRHRHTAGYVSEFHFVPSQTEQLETKIAQYHQSFLGVLPSIAEYKFLDIVKWIEMYGVDMHPVVGEDKLSLLIGLTPTGIVVYKNKQKVGNFYWPRIIKITHRSLKFILKVNDKNNDTHSYIFDLNTKSACKHLYRCAVDQHAFFRLTRRNDLVDSFKPSYRKTRSSKKEETTENNNRGNRSPSQTRTEANFVRTPSKRHQRRKSDGIITDHLSNSAPNFNEFSKGMHKSKSSKGRMTNGQIGDVMYLSDLPDSPRSVRSMKSAKSWSENTQQTINERRSYPIRRDRSMQSIQSEPAGANKNRRHSRHRSRSPGRRPPEELAQHFRYVEMNAEMSNLTEEEKQKMMNIPYIEVKTREPPPRVKTPHARTRRRSPQRSERRTEESEKNFARSQCSVSTYGHPTEPPPPYSPPHLHNEQRYSCPPAYFPPIPPPPILARPDLEGAVHPQPRMGRERNYVEYSRSLKENQNQYQHEQASSNQRNSRLRQRNVVTVNNRRPVHNSLTTQI